MASNVRNKAPALLKCTLQWNPRPVNITTHVTTASILHDDRHPFHIYQKRRSEAFDPDRLHWGVRCAVDTIRKRTMRNWAVRRVKVAFMEQLRAAGYDQFGRRIAQRDATTGQTPPRVLKGAVVVAVGHIGLLTAPFEALQKECLGVVDRVLQMQNQDREMDTSRRRRAVRPVRRQTGF